jgi:hypothetical protein
MDLKRFEGIYSFHHQGDDLGACEKAGEEMGAGRARSSSNFSIGSLALSVLTSTPFIYWYGQVSSLIGLRPLFLPKRSLRPDDGGSKHR